MTTSDLLGAYLRSRRAVTQPAEVGLEAGATLRRVGGLRREEVAMLAGISPAYYTRLEQGRELTPSASAVEGLTRALRLDDTAADYLTELARPAHRSGRPHPELLSVAAGQLVDSWHATPAHVLGRNLDVLHANALFLRLRPGLVPGVNILRRLFLNSAVPGPDHDQSRQRFVSYLRMQVTARPHDEHLISLVTELTAVSDDFRRLWERHDVALPTSMHVPNDHPVVGRLNLIYQNFLVPGADGQMIGAYYASDPVSAEALGFLALPAASNE